MRFGGQYRAKIYDENGRYLESNGIGEEEGTFLYGKTLRNFPWQSLSINEVIKTISKIVEFDKKFVRLFVIYQDSSEEEIYRSPGIEKYI